MGYVFWLVLTIIFTVIEFMGPALVSVWFAFAAFITIFVSLAFDNLKVEITFFTIISILAIMFIRPFAKKILSKKKDNLISKRGKKYNEMLSTLAYSKFDSIITSKCAKNRIFLHKVNPAWTSWIAKQKYCPKMKLNIHSGASYVIARRGVIKR